jgi:hypothetical protein
MKVTEANMSGSVKTFKITANEANSHFVGAAICNCGAAAAVVGVAASLLGRCWEEGRAVVAQRCKWPLRGVDSELAVGKLARAAAAGCGC